MRSRAQIGGEGSAQSLFLLMNSLMLLIAISLSYMLTVVVLANGFPYAPSACLHADLRRPHDVVVLHGPLWAAPFRGKILIHLNSGEVFGAILLILPTGSMLETC